MSHALLREERRPSAASAMPEIGLFSATHRRSLSGPGLRTFLTIADLWRLSETERRAMLGMPSRSTFQNWARSVRGHREITLDLDVLTRISAVLGIHQALGVLHDGESDCIAWLRGPHGAVVFGGASPLALMACGSMDALLTVRRFLDAARGGHYMAPNAIDQNFRSYTDADIVFA